MILNNLSETNIYNQIVDQVRNGLVRVTREKITYTSPTNAYKLESAGSGSVAIHSIQSIEGIDNDGFYRPVSGSFNGVPAWAEDTDYQLSGSSSSTAPDYAGTIAGDTLYDYIVWISSDVPKDGSEFYVTYTYFDETKVINSNRPTSFAPGTISNGFASAFSSIVRNMYNELENSHTQSFVQTATGEDLELHGENYAIDKYDAQPSTGKVSITNNSGSDLTVNLSHRFTTSGYNRKVFKPTQSKVISANSTGTVNVQSVNTGYDQNIGVRTINKMYATSSLTTQVPNVTVTNPGVINGKTNLFNDGSNKEADEPYRKRILNTINKRGTATKSAIEGAITSLSSIASAKVFDWEDKKVLSPPNYEVFVVGSSDKIITDVNIDTEIFTELNEVSPVGSRPIIKKPLGVLVDISGSAYVNKKYWSERSTTQSQINDNITSYMRDLRVGHDIISSKIVDNAISVNNMEKYKINSMKVSEWSFQINNQTPSYLLYASGSNNPYGIEIFKNSRGFRDVFTYDGSNDYTTSGSNINSEFQPSVYIAIQDENNQWVRDPQYSFDYYSSVTASNEITIDPTVGSGTVSLQSGTTNLLFIYDSYEEHTVDGIKITLSGSIASGSVTVEASLWSGSSNPTTKIISKEFSVLSGTSVYDVKFDSTHTFAQDTSKHYLVLSGSVLAPLSGSGQSDVYIVTESDNRSPLKGTNVYSGSISGSTVTWNSYGNINRFPEHSVYRYYPSGSDLSVTGVGGRSEIAVLNDIQTDMYIYTGDDI